MQYQSWMHPQSGVSIIASVFAAGETSECHLCLVPGTPEGIDPECRHLEEAYEWVLKELGLRSDSCVFRRIFLSDAANQAARIAESSLMRGRTERDFAAISLVEQAPLPEHKMALWAYHIDGHVPLKKTRVGSQGVAVPRDEHTHVWLGSLSHRQSQTRPDSATQTRVLFDEALSVLSDYKATLERDVIRTWLFVQNVDVNYQGLVDERRALFTNHGMTADTHYITSTGIEGRHADPARLVLMDLYAVPGLVPEQVRFLHAPENLGPTALYGVTFERGVCVSYGDRHHTFIAGTASIEPGGSTLHVGDIDKQVQRTLDNIEALLSDAHAGFDDVAQMIVYLRDIADRAHVESALAERLPELPRLMVKAPVCRPDWLVEIECIAITPNNDKRFTRF